ncbi:hypothetical protein O9G_002980, partial [Rozella allomycis CSF55]
KLPKIPDHLFSQKLRFRSTSLGIFSLLLLVYHKSNNNTLIFLMQPCHVNLIILMCITLMTTPIRTYLFNVYLHNQWGVSWLAIFNPDLRSHHQPLETFNFFFEHIVLVVLPIYWIYSKKITVWKFSWKFAFQSYWCFAMYHAWILEPLSYISAQNLNYMMAPPPGPLRLFGTYYRNVMFIAGFILTVSTRLIVESIMLVIKYCNKQKKIYKLM